MKGGSNQAAFDWCCHIVHLSSFHLQSSILFEYVASCDSWSDDTSRLLLADPSVAGLGFKLVETSVPRKLWEVSLSDLWRELGDTAAMEQKITSELRCGDGVALHQSLCRHCRSDETRSSVNELHRNTCILRITVWQVWRTYT